MAMLYHGRVIANDEPDRLKKSDDPVVQQFLSGSTEGPILEGRKDAVATK
jgi:phospholipid/cholesterol/gamma-HCH transport system ATP-binding protein